MPSDNRMGWNNEIDSFSRVYMLQMGKVVYDWATGIMNREGKVIGKIDDQILEIEKEIKEKTEQGTKLNKEVVDLEKASSDARMKWQKLIEEASRYKTVANKYILEQENLERLEKGSKAYKDQQTRLKQFEPKYKKWVETATKAEDMKDKYQGLYSTVR